MSKPMKMAMAIGRSHCTMDYIHGRHFLQTAQRAGLPESIARESLAEIARDAENAIEVVESQLPANFPEDIHASVKRGIAQRLDQI